jgi:hypothetical protein
MANSVFMNVGPFQMIVNAYPIRKMLFRHLGALDVAKVICAAKLEEVVGEKEKEKFLNPLRDLFTDAELSDVRKMINEGAAITLWGSDLKRLFERVGDQSGYRDKHQSSVGLHLAITAFPVPRVKTASNKSLQRRRQSVSSSFKKHPISLPGLWQLWTYSAEDPSERSKSNTPDSSSTLTEIPYDFAIERNSYFSRMLLPSADILNLFRYGDEDPGTSCPCHSDDLQYVNLHQSPHLLKQPVRTCWSSEIGMTNGPFSSAWPARVFKLHFRQSKTTADSWSFPQFRYDRYMMQIRTDE